MNDEELNQDEGQEPEIETPAVETPPPIDVRSEMRAALQEFQQQQPQHQEVPQDIETRMAMSLNLRDSMIEEAETLLAGYPAEVVQQVRKEIRNITGLENLQVSQQAGVHITLAKAAAFGKQNATEQKRQVPSPQVSPVHSEPNFTMDDADKALVSKYETLLGVKFTPEELKELAHG